MRPGTKIAKSGAALLTIAAYPLGRSFGGHIESLRRHLQGTTLFDNHPRHLLSTVNRQSGILVVVHSVSLKNSLLVTTSFSRSDRMENLLKLHTYSLSSSHRGQHSIGELAGTRGAADIARERFALGVDGLECLVDSVRRGFFAEMAEHEDGRLQQRRWVGEILAGDVGR